MEADMKLLTLNVDPVCIPDTEYDAVIRMSAVDLHRICKDFKDVSTTIRIRTTEQMDGVMFSCMVSGSLTSCNSPCLHISNPFLYSSYLLG